MFFSEIFCNDRLEIEERGCKSQVGAYAPLTIGCIAIMTMIFFTLVLNNIYKIKDWMNRYDYLSMNVTYFQFFFEVYL